MSNTPSDANTPACPWESGDLGTSAEHAVLASEELALEVDDALALQMISIRLPKRMIADLKMIAEKEGLGYQPLIRRVLTRFIQGEFRSMALEEFRRSGGKGAEQCSDECDASMLRRAAG